MENELVVRLVECAKPLNSVYDSNDPTQVLVTGWADTTTVPKRGEICLEYYTNNDPSSENYGKTCYRMKIGDGIHKYIESDPNDSLPYFPLSDDVINLIASWVNTHLNVEEYAQAYYDNTNHKLKVYSISEQYGKIGHLADGTAIPSLDVEVTFAAGNKIVLASSENILNIAHEDTTRSDSNNNTDITATTNVVTGVTTDATGHVTGITTYKFPANPVEATSTYSANKIMYANGTNKTKESDVEVTATAPTSTSDDKSVPTSKAVDTAIKNRINELDSSVSADTNKVLTGVTEADGKLTAKTDVDYTTIAPVQSVAGDNKWTSVSTSSNTATVSHIGPDTSSTSSATATAGKAPGFGGNVLTGVTIDGKGHVTGVTTGALPSNPVSVLEGTASDTASGITVQVDSTGGEVDNVDVTVALDTLKSALGLTGALISKGTIGTGGTITTLPTASASNLGWAYKVITDGTYGGIQAKVGDVIYCILNDDGETYSWTLIPSGDESFTDTWRNIKVNGTEKLGTGISSGALNIVNGSHSSATWNGTNSTLQIDVDEASTSQKGVVELTDSYTSTDDTKAATGKSIKAAIDAMGVSSDKGAASINGSTLAITAVQQENGLIKDGSTTTISLDGTYNASTNKIATQKTVADAIESLDVEASDTTLDITGTGLDVITEVSEVDGKIASKKKTLYEGNRIDISAASGNITVSHETITTTPTDNSGTVGERESYVITDVTTDGYGHITAYTKDKSTNLIAADIKAPVKRQDDSTWNYRETGGDITIGEDTARIPSLNGNTIVWNQLITNPNFVPGQGLPSAGFVNCNGLLTSSNQLQVLAQSNTYVKRFEYNISSVNGHKYYVKTKLKTSKATVLKVVFGSVGLLLNWKEMLTTDNWYTFSNVAEISGDYSTVSYQVDPTGSYLTGGDEVIVDNFILIDLTKMFGAGNEPTLDEFEKLFPNEYYPYCEGRLVNLGGYGVKMNQLVDTDTSSVTLESGRKYYTVISGTKAVQTGAGSAVSVTGGTDMVIDLTLMFGSGNEPSLEECEQIFTQEYYEYNTGYDCNILDVANKKLELLSTDSTPSTGAFPDESDENTVDMGLPSGLLWARSNIDVTQKSGFAASPYQYKATFFSWGNVKGQNPNSSNAFDESWGSSYDGEPYVSTPGAGLTTNIPYSLDFDAAYRNTGAPWRMPTSAEFQELKDNCDFIDASGNVITGNNKLTTVNGFRGLYLQSKTNGNRLFFSASGFGDESSWSYHGILGRYWSALLDSSSTARGLYFDSGGVSPQHNSTRFLGFAVRPVRSKKQTLDLDWIREIEYTPDGSSTPERLFPYGLLSAGSVADEVHETYAIKRVQTVTIQKTGFIAWNSETSYYKTVSNLGLKNNTNTQLANSTSNLFQITTASTLYETDLKGYYALSSGKNIYISAADYADTSITEFTINYELATPIRIDFSEPHRMSYVVDDHGTEQQLPVNVSSVINAPFRGTFEYMSNFKEGVLDLMGRFSNFTPTTEIIPDSTTANSTLPTSQAVIDYMRAGGNGVKPVYESGDEVIPTTDVHAGLKTEVGNNSYKYYKVPFSAVTNDPSTGTSQVQIILNGNFS